ncbi:MAG: GNAT family N-acetyltransferase [Proteobacteria bacterium]|nr:GNAT family N-acetyltransferase [Pseudomonadota bacterium]
MWTLYQHHKGMHYLHLGQCLHSESSEPFESYLALYDNPRGSLWVRPSGMFHDNGGPRGSKRFVPIGSIRKLSFEESHQVLPFGFDAWGQGKSLNEFVNSYETNKNHLRGQRFVLENSDGEPVSTLNTLRFRDHLTGFAWLATNPDKRKSGYATMLMHGVIALLQNENPEMNFILHSEIGVRYYERFGFEKAPVEHQHFEKSVAMYLGGAPLKDGDERVFKEFF